MSRLIDADKFKKDNEKLLNCDFPYLAEDTLEELIDSAPTVDVEPIRHGKWEDTNSRGFKKCSHCGEDFLAYIVEDYEYCPRCGAKMDEVTEHTD